ncbi:MULTISPECIES: hypothetical protein [Desulfococcus]|uniref:Uncharacterized protein n=1 Tax=Desulfococcus multivorans DSM 2059 TaxID=1121405 RepID=S7UPU0_DESML|nr:hypothetical protein [Desulfococcus multivorans]AOY60072.1 uncharacterized protein Dmul_33020 [Desulfococcus multivorans]AQV02210.1 hypothetical protein B2D07_16520 [Desulfococcus multivorans]EPR36064.1 hypothetical protein dsmv_0769 [Desulfococcus multivorans DSM 2059]SJZ37840.1 hypothetical protein SAMN02745446_00289 [Desulfococcus multivorans DSM 2059]
MRIDTPVRQMDMSEVKAGDVLLSYGDGWISDVIRLVDGGDYSHAAFFDGNNIVEAGLRGVVVTPLESEVAAQKYVDVYRFKSDSGSPFSLPDWPVEPVIERAHYYFDKGTKYADNQLYLVGVLIVVRKLPYGRVEKAVLRAVLDMIFKLFKRIAEGRETKSVVCSELVYRSFYEAVPEKKYGLSIKGALAPFKGRLDSLVENESGEDDLHDAEIEETIRRIERTYWEIRPELAASKDEIHTLLKAGNPLVAAEMVSPHDLQISPNLEKIGRVRKPAR